jgi:Ca-activated chloride channel family protein
MKIKARMSYEKVRHDKENNVHLVISLQAPKLAWQEKRPPVCIIPIIDVSGSMAGEKLDYAKKTLFKLIDHLKPGDYCGLGAFSTDVYPIQQPIEMTQAQKDALKVKIGELTVHASTCFSGGLELGLKWGQADLPGNMLIRVIMLTDGLANQGVTSRDGLLQIVRTRGRATVSCFGYGTDADQELLADVAKVGDGNYAFIKNPDEALTAFGKELGGLLSTYAQGIILDLAPHNGHEIAEVLSDVDVEEKGEKVIVKLGDILSEEQRHIVVVLKLSEQTQALPRDMNVVDVRVEYDLLDDGKRSHRQEELKAKVRFVKPGEEQEKPDPEVDKIVGMAQLARAQVASEEHAKKGDYVGAQAVMQNIGEAFSLRGLGGLQQLAQGVQARVASHAVYLSNQGYLKSARGYTSRPMAVSCMADDLCREVETSGLLGDFALQNEAQKAVADSFVGDAGGGASASPGWLPGWQAPVAPSAPTPAPPASAAPASAKPEPKKGVTKSRSKRW